MSKARRWIAKHWGDVAFNIVYITASLLIVDQLERSGWIQPWREEPVWYFVKFLLVAAVTLCVCSAGAAFLSQLVRSWREA